jgi:hypothetical protein
MWLEEAPALQAFVGELESISPKQMPMVVDLAAPPRRESASGEEWPF